MVTYYLPRAFSALFDLYKARLLRLLVMPLLADACAVCLVSCTVCRVLCAVCRMCINTSPP